MKNLLASAIREITELRKQNSILQAKVDTMDLFATVLLTKPYIVAQGYGEDVAWALQKELDLLNSDAAPDAAPEVVKRR